MRCPRSPWPTSPCATTPRPCPTKSCKPWSAACARAKVHPLAERLHVSLERTSRLLDTLDASAASAGKPNGESRMLIDGQIEELKVMRSEALRLFDPQASNNRALKAGQSANPLQSPLQSQVADRFDQALAALEKVRKAGVGGGSAYRQAVTDAKQSLFRLYGERVARENTLLPQSPQQRYRGLIPSGDGVPSKTLPQYVIARNQRHAAMYAYNGNGIPDPLPADAATSCGYNAADLAATADAPLNQEIKDLAKSLDFDARKIYQYVYNEIKFEPYWGATKGAMGALWSKAGGPMDQASLTVALLRASNIPARYVRGTAIFHDDRGRKWVGAKTDIAAAQIFSQALYPTITVLTSGGLKLPHVWVEACVPYGNYRGTRADATASRWVPLDPSFKDMTYQDGIAHNVKFDYDGYLAARTNVLPHEKMAQQVAAAIKSMGPRYANNSLADVPYAGTLVKREYDVLPASLPYEVYSYDSWDANGGPSEAAVLPDSHRVQVSINALGIDKQYALADLAFKRVTYSFQGATANDQAALDAWKNDPAGNPSVPCSVNVIPVLKLDGVIDATGNPIGLCAPEHEIALKAWIPDPLLIKNGADTVISQTTRTTSAADYNALIISALQGERMLQDRVAKLLAAVRANGNPLSDQDATEGEFLSVAGLKYARYAGEASRYLGALNGFSNEPWVYLGLSKSKARINYLFDLPYAASLSGAVVDVSAGYLRLAKLDSTSYATMQPEVRDMFRLSLYAGSAYEHYIWQETARVDAVSTVRGIQFARETSIPMATFTAANIGNYRSLVDASLWGYENTIRQALQDGNGQYIADAFVYMPTRTISYTGDGVSAPWVGAVYEVNWPDSVSMIIAGGFNGGYALLASPPAAAVLQIPSDYLNIDTVNDIATTFILTGTPTSVNGSSSSSITTAGDPVNMLTGNMYHTERDIAVKSRGLPIVFTRTYNSLRAADGPLGFGWTHSFNQYLKLNGVESGTAKVSWVDGTGAEHFYITTAHDNGNITAGSTLQAQPGVYQTLSRAADGSYSVREKNGLTYRFESVNGTATNTNQKARLTAITDRNGNTITVSYAAWPNVVVSDALGRSLTLKHDANGRIYEVADWTGALYRYEYDGAGNLIAYKNPLAVAGSQPPVAYSYYTSGQLNHAMQRYTLPRGNSMTFEYYANGKVLRHTTSQGESNSFVYNDFRLESRATNERGLTR
ncbi:MAG: DUF6531 domain-containing protein, partial [Betaproteobacteria bacterium]|nr:DUF6531 domain-containing protein [Betaproteobacteria bacterium]